MNGRCLAWNGVRKNRATGVFEGGVLEDGA
jgi:hypothetical protein